MAQPSKAGMKKISQEELRRLMNEQRSKLVKVPKKIDSPLANYTSSGQLMCILCGCVVRSEALWQAHIISKEHKNYRSRTKQLGESVATCTRSYPVTYVQSPASMMPEKRPASNEQLQQPKKLKGILKNVVVPLVGQETLDVSTPPNETQKTDTVPLKKTLHEAVLLPKHVGFSDLAVKPTSKIGEAKKSHAHQEDSLPKGFFDDPELDAKARNIEYKNPVEMEWAKFQKEIKEETDVSAQIIAEDQDMATAERQIDEIDEQMRNWGRVIDLEQKVEEARKQVKIENDGSSSADEVEFDEFPDWRRKKAYAH